MLFTDEMKRRRDFYADQPDTGKLASFFIILFLPFWSETDYMKFIMQYIKHV